MLIASATCRVHSPTCTASASCCFMCTASCHTCTAAASCRVQLQDLVEACFPSWCSSTAYAPGLYALGVLLGLPEAFRTRSGLLKLLLPPHVLDSGEIEGACLLVVSPVGVWLELLLPPHLLHSGETKGSCTHVVSSAGPSLELLLPNAGSESRFLGDPTVVILEEYLHGEARLLLPASICTPATTNKLWQDCGAELNCGLDVFVKRGS